MRGFGSNLRRNCFNRAKFVQRQLIKFFVEDFFINFQKKYQDRKKTTGVNLWWKECIYGWIGNRIDWKQKRKRNDSHRAWVRIRSLSVFSINKKMTRVYLSIFLLKKFFVNFQINNQDKTNSTVVNLWSKVCIYGSIRIRMDKNQKRKRNISYFDDCTDRVAEWLRRWTANPIRSACVGSNPISVVFFF